MKKYKRRHKATLMDLPVGFADIDNNIIDLVLAVNELGLYTTMSCESNVRGRIWLQFADCGMAERFLTICNQNNKLTWFIKQATPSEYEKAKRKMKFKGRWWVDVNPRFDVRSVHLRPSVRFPKKHLPLVMKMLNKEIERKSA